MHQIKTVFRTYHLADEHALVSFSLGVRRWALHIRKVVAEMSPTEVFAKLPTVLDETWVITRIRCQLLQKIAQDSNAWNDEEKGEWAKRLQESLLNVCYAFMAGNRRVVGVEMVRAIVKDYKWGEDLLTFIWIETDYCPDPADRFGWRDHTIKKGIPTAIYYPSDHVSIDSSIDSFGQQFLDLREQRIDTCRKGLLTGQREAFDSLRLMLRAREVGLTAGGIRPRLHGLIIGPSGSGKTHVVRTVAQAEKLPLYEQSAASWMPQGSKTDNASTRRVAQFVEAHEKGIIYLDEIEKPFPPQSSVTTAWERYCTDEFMSLLDAKVAEWDYWSVALAKKLDKSFFIVLSGAWQAAYTSAFKVHSLLGGDWTNLSIADSFLEENHLPPELLNRVSTNVIEVLPPSRAELVEMIKRVQEDLGLGIDEAEAMLAAKEIVQERKGVRAVEEYMLKRWMRKQAEPEKSGGEVSEPLS